MGSRWDIAFSITIVLCIIIFLGSLYASSLNVGGELVRVDLPSHVAPNGEVIEHHVIVNQTYIDKQKETANENRTVQSGNSMVRVNGLWINDFGSYNAADIAQACADGNIKYLYVSIGSWLTNGSGVVTGIYEWPGRSKADMIELAGDVWAVDPNIQIFAWVLAMQDYPEIDINVDNTLNQYLMTTYARQYVKDTGIDGFHDDTETKDGSNSNLVAIWNAMGTGLHTDGKLFSVATYMYAGDDKENLYPYLDNTCIDAVCPMLYDQTGSYAAPSIADYMDWVLTHTDCNVTIGLCCTGVRQNLTDQLSQIDTKIAASGPYANFYGCCLWEYDIISSSDWAVWNAWTTKDGETPPGYFYGDFEDDKTSWTGDWNGAAGTSAISTTNPYAGSKMLACTITAAAGDWAREYKTLASAKTTFYNSCYVKFSALPANGEYLQISPMLSITDGSITLADLRIYNDAGAYKWALRHRGGGASVYAYSSEITPVVDTWYFAEVGVFVAGGTGWAKAWVAKETETDAVAESSPTISATALTNNDAGGIQRLAVGGYNTAGTAYIIYVDEVYAADTFKTPDAQPTTPGVVVGYYLQMMRS